MIDKMGPECFKIIPKAEQNPNGTDTQDLGWSFYLWAYAAVEEAKTIVRP